MPNRRAVLARAIVGVALLGMVPAAKSSTPRWGRGKIAPVELDALRDLYYATGGNASRYALCVYAWRAAV